MTKVKSEKSAWQTKIAPQWLQKPGAAWSFRRTEGETQTEQVKKLQVYLAYDCSVVLEEDRDIGDTIVSHLCMQGTGQEDILVCWQCCLFQYISISASQNASQRSCGHICIVKIGKLRWVKYLPGAIMMVESGVELLSRVFRSACGCWSDICTLTKWMCLGKNLWA